jgi:hypothetical protein
MLQIDAGLNPSRLLWCCARKKIVSLKDCGYIRILESQHIHQCDRWIQKDITTLKMKLSLGESNPGLPRSLSYDDKRKS